jgi:hypothetical protein
MAPVTAAEMIAGLRRYQAILDSPQSHLDYAQLPGTCGGKLLDVDLARLLFPDYAASHDGVAQWTIPMHPLASAWVYREFKRRILLAPRSFVLHLAGGGGSGKSSLLATELAQILEDCEVAIDGVMSDQGRTFDRMDQLLDFGRKITYVYAWAHFKTAYQRVRDRELRMGRPVPRDVLAKAHVGAQNTFLAVHQEYSDLEEVTVYAYDTTAVPPRRISIDDIRAMRYARPGECEEETAVRLLATLSETDHDDPRRPTLQ